MQAMNKQVILYLFVACAEEDELWTVAVFNSQINIDKTKSRI